jgi:hypothetical protein
VGSTSVTTSQPVGSQPVNVELPVSAFASPQETDSYGNPVPRTCPVVSWSGPIYLREVSGRIVGVLGETRIFPIFWPSGFRAVFDPDFSAVITESGAVFARSGDDLNSDVGGHYHGRNDCISDQIDYW